MITVLSRQSLLDIAIQHAGSAEAAFLLAAANGVSITDTFEAGIEFESVAATDREIFSYYKNNGLKPATGFSGDGTGDELEEGIEFWYVEYDFVVS